MIFSYFTLAVGIIISAISAYYSVMGLTTIFAAAFWPIVIMGTALEIGKITASMWLKIYWKKATVIYKLYLIPAVLMLMLLTSMGIFGGLSKAHSDQNLISGNVQSKIAVYDEKIKTAKENIEADRRQLKQMDEAVDQIMARSTTEEGASRSSAIRKAQARDRSALAKSIETNQKLITALNDEAAPIRAEVRKIENETGPIKYIAALIYGDNPDSNLLERSVRWVIIVIVIVFDPLAIILILAANSSLKIDSERKNKTETTDSSTVTTTETVTVSQKEIEISAVSEEILDDKVKSTNNFNLSDYPYLFKTPESRHPPGVEPVLPQVYKDTKSIVVTDNTLDYAQAQYDTKYTLNPTTIKLEEVTDETNINDIKQIHETDSTDDLVETVEKPRFDENQEYVHFDGKLTSIKALKETRPDLIVKDKNSSIINFGSKFPQYAFSGEFCIRTDTKPHKVYKFESKKWVNVDKNAVTIYLQNVQYIRYLINQIEAGEYHLDYLTDSEQHEITNYINRN
jgi:hypothetical protein